MFADGPQILAVRATFDGQRVVLPDEMRGVPPGRVIVIFENTDAEDRTLWLKAQEAAFAKAWDNAEHAVYDQR
jgi:hypothetical protein